jgi:hypothetical protein
MVLSRAIGPQRLSPSSCGCARGDEIFALFQAIVRPHPIEAYILIDAVTHLPHYENISRTKN